MSGPRAEFWKLRGLRGNKKNEKNVRRSRDDLLQLTIQGKFPAYERVLLREGGRPKPEVSATKGTLRIALTLLCRQLISNGPSSSWVLSTTSPWRSWPERCPMSTKWQVSFGCALRGRNKSNLIRAIVFNADMVPRSGADSSSTVIKLETVRRIAEKVSQRPSCSLRLSRLPA